MKYKIILHRISQKMTYTSAVIGLTHELNICLVVYRFILLCMYTNICWVYGHMNT